MACTPRAMLLSCLVLYMLCTGAWAQTLLDPIPRPCRTLGNDGKGAVVPGTARNEYPAGGTMMVLAQVPAGIKGIFEFYLCPEEGNSKQEECLIRVPLQLANGSGTKFDMSQIAKSGSYEIPVIIPDDTSCTACTLQWRVLVEDCADKECQVMDEKFCADISVREIKSADKRIFGLIFTAIRGILGG